MSDAPNIAPAARAKGLSTFRAEFLESFRMALGSLADHKLRSALTLLGVLVGVFSIIVVMTTMRATQHFIETNVRQLGGETFIVRQFGGFQSRRDAKYWRRPEITLRQGYDVRDRAILASSVGFEAQFQVTEITSATAKSTPNASLLGETPGSFPAQNWTLDEGRILQDADVDSGRNVCVLGGKLAKDLFPFGSAVGERIKVQGLDFTVAGVLEAQGTSSGGNQDNFAIIPITAALEHFGSPRQSINILVAARDRDVYEETVDQVRSILRAVRKVPPGGEDDFDIVSPDSIIAQINAFTFVVRMAVGAISSIALIAAGIGIMNIMLVSVTERTREIGVRRAIGAKKRNIMIQFIMEAVVLCEIGGVAGVILGIAGGDIGAHFMHMEAVIPFDWAIFGLVICSVVGIVFGTYPAWKAANLDPIESLRYE